MHEENETWHFSIASAWRPRGPGLFTVRLGAKELRTGMGKKDRATTEIEVDPKP